jgi:DNA repair exonuclease SbcCD ATPase subunit
MTTIHQQISFVKDLRESYDNNQREVVTNNRPPEAIAELLRDIEENLHAMRLAQYNKPIQLCERCNQPVKNLLVSEKYCERCAAWEE